MGKVAYVFPGQGSQVVGMGKALYDQYPEAREVFDAADDGLHEKLSTLCFEGPEEELRRTSNAQPAILTVSLAAHAVVAKRLPAPDYVAGHSLGEFSALTAAGAIRLCDAVRIVRERGRLMQEAVPEGQGAMAAVLGLDAALVEQACKEAAAETNMAVQTANLNEPTQTVISGGAAAVAKASEKATALGARKVIPLKVSAPFHSALMAPVQSPLRALLNELEFHPLEAPVISNVEAAPNADLGRLVDLLVAQVTEPVRWVESIVKLQTLGVDRYIELGPGRVLGGLIKRIDRTLTIFNVEDPVSWAKTEAGLVA